MIDAGGYRGEFANHVASTYGCDVRTFEPVPVVADRVETGANVRLERAALAGSTGTATMFAADGMSSTLKTGIADEVSRVQGPLAPIEVRTIELGEYMEDEGIRDVALLKLDIEGAEADVLESLPDEALGRIAQVTTEFHAFVDPDLQAGVDRASRRLEAAGFWRLDFTTLGMDVLFVNERIVRLSRIERAWIVARHKYAPGVRRRLTRLLKTGRLT